jgi:hypothetical protein
MSAEQEACLGVTLDQGPRYLPLVSRENANNYANRCNPGGWQAAVPERVFQVEALAAASQTRMRAHNDAYGHRD